MVASGCLIPPLPVRAEPVTENALQVLAGGVTRRPGPLKVETTEMAGDIDDLADEIEPGNGFGFERFRGKPRCIDAAQRHLGGAINPCVLFCFCAVSSYY